MNDAWSLGIQRLLARLNSFNLPGLVTPLVNVYRSI